MIVGVRRLRHRGVALASEQRQRVMPMVGDLRIGEQRVPYLGRTCLVAALLVMEDHARGLPPLFDKCSGLDAKGTSWTPCRTWICHAHGRQPRPVRTDRASSHHAHDR